MAININDEKCIGCGSCVAVCPVEALMLEKSKVKVNKDACIDCGVCVAECSEDVLSL